AAVPAEAIIQVGADAATPAPGVLEAIADADFVLFPPSDPVVSIGPILAVPGVRAAVEAKTVVGVSGIIGGAPVRGMADACLTAIGVQTSAAAVAAHYGRDLLNGWLVDEQDKTAVDDPALAASRYARCRCTCGTRPRPPRSRRPRSTSRGNSHDIRAAGHLSDGHPRPARDRRGRRPGRADRRRAGRRRGAPAGRRHPGGHLESDQQGR